MSAGGLSTMMGIQRKIRWKGIVIWLLALTATLATTAASIAPLYNTPAKIRSYADSVAGGSLYAINGKVEGIASLGGIIQDEFAFIAAFLLPLLGISLIAGSTRREEEAGRLELLLSGRIGRRSPLVSALLVATGVIAVVVVAFAVVVAVSGVPVSSSILYAASLGGLAFVFVGVSAVIAQMTLHSRGVYFGGFAVLLVSYVLRGIGDVNGSLLSWLSPLGWQEKTAPTGDQRWWVLLIPVVVGGALATLAIHHAGRRDLGSAMISAGSGPPRASHGLRSPLGFATRLHRQSMLGWLAGSVVLGVMMGALSQQAIDALEGNPSMAEALGAGHGSVGDGFIAVVQLYLAIIAMGYLAQAIGILRHEESAQRLEMRLTGTLSRIQWLTAHATVILSGLVVVVVVSSASFGIASAISTGDSGQVTILLRAGIAYLPAEVIFAGLALMLFGMFPRRFAVSWAVLRGRRVHRVPRRRSQTLALDSRSLPDHPCRQPTNGHCASRLADRHDGDRRCSIAAGFFGFRKRDIPSN